MKRSIFSKSMFCSVVFALFIITSGLVPVSAAESKSGDMAGEGPIHVTSDKMIAQREGSMVEFIGNARATRGDSIVLADSIQIYFIEKAKGNDAQNNIKKIVSTGNVEYTAGERKAYADKAVYTAADNVLVLTGKSPKLITGESFVTGKKITLYRNQDKVVVESDSSKRVEALFNPEDNTTDKQ